VGVARADRTGGERSRAQDDCEQDEYESPPHCAQFPTASIERVVPKAAPTHSARRRSVATTAAGAAGAAPVVRGRPSVLVNGTPVRRAACDFAAPEGRT